MKKLRSIGIVLFSLVMLFVLSGCGKTAGKGTGAGESQPAAQLAAITVAAAASITDAMNELKDLYNKEKPEVTITYTFSSSGSLQKQIENGAEVDLFISAAQKQMDMLKEKGLLVDDTRINLVGNRLVLITPKDSAAVAGFDDLTGEKVEKVALGEPASVPAGQYAEEALTKMGLLEKVKPKAVYAKDVREVLTWVETGNADAGMVYETDAKISDKVKIVAAAPDGTYQAITYPAAVIKASKNMDPAKEFLQFMTGEKAKAVFEKYGFVFMPK